MVHIHCGDSSAEVLRQSTIPGEVVVWSELLFTGPIRTGASPEAFRQERAAFLSKSTGGARSPEQTAQWLEKQDSALEAARQADEIVLWFDACMYDQTILAHLLNWFHKHPCKNGQLKLISVGTFTGRPKFAGLGELTPEELASLFPQRTPVTEDQLQFAGDACDAIRAEDPRRVQAVLNEGHPQLPYLNAALERFLEQYPSVLNGLSRLQQEILEEVERGAQSPGCLFHALSEREENSFFGDTLVWKTINELADASEPALRLDGPGALPLWEPSGLRRWSMALTGTGSALLANRADWLDINGIDTWIGGVHLTRQHTWRWDTEAGTLVAPG